MLTGAEGDRTLNLRIANVVLIGFFLRSHFLSSEGIHRQKPLKQVLCGTNKKYLIGLSLTKEGSMRIIWGQTEGQTKAVVLTT